MAIRILIVDDNTINQKIAHLILKRLGYEAVDVVCDGEKAVEACRVKEYDILLMDCQMPVMDGLEATRQIRKLERVQPIIIAVTAHAFLGQREACLESGMNDYLSKPYRAEQLIQIIHSSLRQNGSA